MDETDDLVSQLRAMVQDAKGLACRVQVEAVAMERALTSERDAWRERARQAERALNVATDKVRLAEHRLDEIGRDARLVRGGLAKHHTVEVRTDEWAQAQGALDELDGIRRRRWVLPVVVSLALVGAASMAMRIVELLAR